MLFTCITSAIHCSQAIAMVLTDLGPELITSLVFFLKASTRCAMSVACCS